MAKQQRKEPWNSRVNREGSYKEEGRTNRQKSERSEGMASTVFLSILVFLMFAIIGGAIFFTIWNNRNPNMNTVASNFYPAASKSSSSAASSSASSTSSSTDTSSSSASSSGSNTYTVVAGDYPSVIAQKTGVSWDTIVKLSANSTKKLDPNNPGYYKDGSQLTVGDVLVISK